MEKAILSPSCSCSCLLRRAKRGCIELRLHRGFSKNPFSGLQSTTMHLAWETPFIQVLPVFLNTNTCRWWACRKEAKFRLGSDLGKAPRTIVPGPVHVYSHVYPAEFSGAFFQASILRAAVLNGSTIQSLHRLFGKLLLVSELQKDCWVLGAALCNCPLLDATCALLLILKIMVNHYDNQHVLPKTLCSQLPFL